MAFRKFQQNKLWRDKAVDLVEQIGSKVYWTSLSTMEFKDEIKRKFIEEAEEVGRVGTREELIDELGDILEVINSMADVYQFTMDEVIAAQMKKRETKGSFKGRKFVTSVEHEKGSFGERYCLEEPAKYPELND